MKSALAMLALFVLAAFGACRSPDPKTPPNSPIPTIDRPEDPKPPPSPNVPSELGDASDAGT